MPPDDQQDQHGEERRTPGTGPGRERDGRTGKAAAAARMQHQAQWVELQLQQAVERGDFADLPGYGKPIRITDEDDPDWWVRQLVEREQVTGVLPPALALRTEDAGLDDALDRLASEREVRRHLEDFNERVLHARYTNPGGPPLVTMPREVDEEVDRWRARRQARSAPDPRPAEQRSEEGRRRWWRRR